MLATISQSFDIYIDIMWQELDWEVFITQQSENFNVEERLFFNNDFFLKDTISHRTKTRYSWDNSCWWTSSNASLDPMKLKARKQM